MISLRQEIPKLFTEDTEVIDLMLSAFPIVIVMQTFDALSAITHGLMRGIGCQEFGGYLNLVVYNGIAIPVSFCTAFLLHWKLNGLWTGITTGLGM